MASLNLSNICVSSYSRPSKSRGAYGRPKTRNPFPSTSFASNGSSAIRAPVFPTAELLPSRRPQNNHFPDINMYVVGTNTRNPLKPMRPLPHNSVKNPLKPKLKQAQHQRFLSISHCNKDCATNNKLSLVQPQKTKDYSCVSDQQENSPYKLTFYNPKERTDPKVCEIFGNREPAPGLEFSQFMQRMFPDKTKPRTTIL